MKRAAAFTVMLMPFHTPPHARHHTGSRTQAEREYEAVLNGSREIGTDSEGLIHDPSMVSAPQGQDSTQPAVPPV